MILLDTNVLSELMKSTPETTVLQWMDALPAAEYSICAISKAEIQLGIALLPDGKRKVDLERAATLMFAEFPNRCLSFDADAASQYAAIVAKRTRIGRPVSVEDAQIAAIAVTQGLTLATRNTKDFKLIENLSLINPWKISAGKN